MNVHAKFDDIPSRHSRDVHENWTDEWTDHPDMTVDGVEEKNESRKACCTNTFMIYSLRKALNFDFYFSLIYIFKLERHISNFTNLERLLLVIYSIMSLITEFGLQGYKDGLHLF